MKVRIEVGLVEVREAIVAWLVERGVPLVAAGSMVLRFKSTYQSDMAEPDTAVVRVEFEAEQYSSQDVVIPQRGSPK